MMTMTIGILGGGQLARMLILSGKPLGLNFVVYCDKVTDTIANLAEIVIGELDQFEQLDQFLNKVDVVTFENENIPEATLNYLKGKTQLRPTEQAIYHAQDRLHEKTLFNELDIATNQYRTIDSEQDLKTAANELGLPLVLKSRRLGYDGKNQYLIKTAADLEKANALALKNYLAEEFVAFDREVSIVAVRSADDECRAYDLCQNHHEQGILRISENKKNDPLWQDAFNAIEKILNKFNYIGVLALEFFVKDNQLIANEMAPRVHNSGHWTMNGCVCSQFENHVRAIAGLPLGSVESTTHCIMTNIIGEWPDRQALQQTANLAIHDYQKTPRTNRKLGHVNQIKSNDCTEQRKLFNS